MAGGSPNQQEPTATAKQLHYLKQRSQRKSKINERNNER